MIGMNEKDRLRLLRAESLNTQREYRSNLEHLIGEIEDIDESLNQLKHDNSIIFKSPLFSGWKDKIEKEYIDMGEFVAELKEEHEWVDTLIHEKEFPNDQ